MNNVDFEVKKQTMTDNKKPLGEWTLAEVKEYCQTHKYYASGISCMFYSCLCPRTSPNLWDLDDEKFMRGLSNGEEA